MIYRSLLAVTVVITAVAFVFQSPPAAVAAAVVGLFAFTAKGLDR